MGWQGQGRVASPREGSRIIFGIYIGALKMQVGWQGVGRVANPRGGSKHEHLNCVWNLYRSHKNAGGLAGSRWGGRVWVGWQVLGRVVNIKILFGIDIGALEMQVGW